MNPLRESRIVRLSLLLFFVLLIAYGTYEAGSLLWGPQIRLPGDTVVISESHATIRGATQNVADLTLNGTVVSMTEDGIFEKEVVLMPGSNRLSSRRTINTGAAARAPSIYSIYRRPTRILRPAGPRPLPRRRPERYRRGVYSIHYRNLLLMLCRRRKKKHLRRK